MPGRGRVHVLGSPGAELERSGEKAVKWFRHDHGDVNRGRLTRNRLGAHRTLADCDVVFSFPPLGDPLMQPLLSLSMLIALALALEGKCMDTKSVVVMGETSYNVKAPNLYARLMSIPVTTFDVESLRWLKNLGVRRVVVPSASKTVLEEAIRKHGADWLCDLPALTSRDMEVSPQSLRFRTSLPQRLTVLACVM